MIEQPIPHRPQGPYRAHAAFVAAARADRTPLWRLLAGLALIEMAFVGGLTLFDRAAALVSPRLADEIYYGDTARGLIAQLGSYAVLGLGVAFVVLALHGRSPMTIFGPLTAPSGRLKRLFWKGFLGAFCFYMAYQLLPPWTDLRTAQTMRPLGGWLLSLPFAIGALLLQTASEEMLYRGHIQQLLAARWRSPAVWLILPNLAFASVHWETGAGTVENWQYVIWAFCFGLACSDLTARTGSLGPAIGLHLANNAYAFLFFGELNAPDSGLALMLFPAYDPGAMPGEAGGPVLSLSFMVELAVVALAWLSARLALRR